MEDGQGRSRAGKVRLGGLPMIDLPSAIGWPWLPMRWPPVPGRSGYLAAWPGGGGHAF